jgi:hypothetical protein
MEASAGIFPEKLENNVFWPEMAHKIRLKPQLHHLGLQNCSNEQAVIKCSLARKPAR